MIKHCQEYKYDYNLWYQKESFCLDLAMPVEPDRIGGPFDGTGSELLRDFWATSIYAT